MLDNTKLWEDAMTEIELKLSKANFSTWFKDAYIAKNEDNTVCLSLPNQFVKDWVADKYNSLILKTLRSISNDIRAVEYTISKERSSKKVISATSSTHSAGAGSLPLHDLYVNKEDNLNPRYDFDTFVIGPFNELAHAAAQAIIKSPGIVYNPLFIYGKTGLGKTHLIQAVGNEIKKQNKAKKVYYVTSERFSQDLVNALQSNQIKDFKEKFRKYDLFIVDDVQFLSNKEKTQEELFHLFNALYDGNKQIIFSCDQHPNYIPGLEERLKSRFSAGMIVDIPSPDRETRTAILKSKAQSGGFALSDKVAEFVSSVMQGNVRELEGALNSIVCQSQLKNKELTLDEVKSLLKNNIKPKRIVSVSEVVRTVSGYFNISEESIYKKTRKKEVVKPRQLIMYILREDFSLPYPTIGQKLGGRDHTTVIHSYEKIKGALENDGSLAQEINQIRAML